METYRAIQRQWSKEEERHTDTRETMRSTTYTVKQVHKDQNKKVAALYVKEPAIYIHIYMYTCIRQYPIYA